MRTYTNPYTISSQRYLVLEHLFSKKSITHVEAEAVYKIRRLAARISELKNDGWNIKCLHRKDLAGQRYGHYSLIKPYHFVQREVYARDKARSSRSNMEKKLCRMLFLSTAK